MKSGFTLIELLAVIVILAIIALIATPIILNIIDSSKEESIERSKELYLEAAKEAIVRKNLTSELNPNNCTVQSDGNLKCLVGEETVDLIVETNGQRPCTGNIAFKNGKVESESIEFCNSSSKEKYTKLEYLESTNIERFNPKNWIDTGVKASSDLIFEAEYESLRYADNPLFGGASNGSRDDQIVFDYWNGSFLIWWNTKDPNGYFNYKEYSSLNVKYKMKMSKDGCWVNDTLVADNFPETEFNTSDFPGNILLFGFNIYSNNKIYTAGQYKVYYFKIWEGDKLIRDFIPVLDSDNIPCMYDKVEDKFYYNQGTEDFKWH